MKEDTILNNSSSFSLSEISIDIILSTSFGCIGLEFECIKKEDVSMWQSSQKIQDPENQLQRNPACSLLLTNNNL